MGLTRDHPRHAGAGEEPHACCAWAACAHCGSTAAGPAGGEDHDSVYADARVAAAGTRRRRSTPWTPRASTWPCCSRPGGSSCSASTRSRRSAPDGLEPPYATAIARAYNDYSRTCATTRPTACTARRWWRPTTSTGAVREARRCVEELGFKAIFLAPGCVNRRPWHHPAYDPLWAEIERLDVPITFHGGGQTYLTPDFSLGRARRADAVAHVQPAAGDPVRDRVLLRRRRARAVPEPAGRRCSRATARGRRGCCTASTSTTSGRAGRGHPT